jgi:hypothetical protein
MNGLRRLGIALSTAGVLFLSSGCSQQPEGDRCDLAASGHADCEDELVCTAKDTLKDKDVDRCCPETLTDETDERCAPATAGQFDSPD